MQHLPLKTLVEKHPEYSRDVIEYHCSQLIQQGYIAAKYKIDNSGKYLIMYFTDLTPEGHTFLATIKPEPFWNKLKAGAVKFGSENMKMLFELLKDHAFEYLKELLMNNMQ